jgi:hypothetical protein
MTHASLLNRDWQGIVERLGGAEAIERSARAARAFLRPRVIGNAVDLLRLVLAYCLGPGGLRSTTAWASAIGLVDISNVGLLQRLRGSGDWLGGAGWPGAFERRAGGQPLPSDAPDRRHRIHSGFELPAERFGFFEVTD